MSYPAIGLGYLIAFVAAGAALRGYPFLHSVFAAAGLLIPAGAIVLIIRRRRPEWAGCQRLFWDTIAIGISIWAIGHVGWAFGDILEDPSWLRWHTLFSLCGGTAPLIALIARPHRGVRAEATSRTALDLASYALLAGFIYTYFVIIPSFSPEPGIAPEVTLVAVAQTFRFVLLVGLILTAWFARHTGWSATFRILAFGVGVGFVFRLDASRAILEGSYQSGTVRDLAWIVPFLCYAWAALVSPASPRQEERESVAAVPSAFISAVPVFLIPVVGYGWLYASSLGAAADSFRGLVTSLMTVGGLGLLTLRLAAQGDELRVSDAKVKLLAAAMERTGDLILITKADGSFAYANEAFLRATGYTRAELAPLQFADFIQPGFEKLGDHIGSEVLARGIWRGTLLQRRRDGSTFPSACTVVALKDAAGAVTHFVGVERDITEELQLRDQLVHSERLSAVGELVAGVAHEINNPLQTIVGCVELMLDGTTDTEQRQDLELVKKEAGRAGQIVRNLLSFVRRSAPDRVSADLNHIVRVTVDLRAYHLQQSNIRLDVRYHGEALQVQINREEIQQIILNLLMNAEHALTTASGGGTITIRTMRAGRYQAVEVADDGPGISPELRGRIFEPFFTTKEVGQGTGLGLSISHGIATAHGGALELCGVQSGACFRLTLPAQDIASPSGRLAESADSSIAR